MLATVDWLVSVGSVDGICTTAAVLRNARSECGIEFCQAFTVNRINPSSWPPSRRVLFIGLAVNNREEAMTANFLRRITQTGHTVIGILDEHRADDWRSTFSQASLRFTRLLVQPVSGIRLGLRSAGAFLLSLFGNEADDHTRELCEAADAADGMNFATHFGKIVNSSVKPNRHDDSRRVYLARHLAKNRQPDTVIQNWMSEYDKIVKNHDEIIAARQDLGDGLVRVVTFGRAVDMSALLGRLFDLGCCVAVLEAEIFSRSDNARIRQIAFGGAPGLGLNLARLLRSAGIPAAGYYRKPSVRIGDETKSIEIIREALRDSCKENAP